MSVALAQRKVLVLNKGWTPVGITNLEHALSLLFSETMYHGLLEPKARIIHTEDFNPMTWADWSKMRPKDGEDVIHASHGRTFRIPEVILLTKYEKLPQQRVHFSRRTIYRRDGNTCQYCGCKPGTEELSIDHITPRHQNGVTSWENCVLACTQCNVQKANRRPEEAFKPAGEAGKKWRGPSPMKLLSKPRKPKLALFKGDRQFMPKSWDQFISEAYWETTLQE